MMTYPEGMSNLNVEYAEGIQLAYGGYSKRDQTARRFTVTLFKQKHLTSLMYWFKESSRLEEPIELSNIHNEVTLRAEIKAAHKRELFIKEQKRKGEAMITDDLQVELGSALQWERW